MTSFSKEEEARLREEMRNLEADFQAVEESYGDNFLKLTTARGYLKSLLSNAKVIRWLTQRHPEIAAEFETIVASEAMQSTIMPASAIIFGKRLMFLNDFAPSQQ